MAKVVTSCDPYGCECLDAKTSQAGPCLGSHTNPTLPHFRKGEEGESQSELSVANGTQTLVWTPLPQTCLLSMGSGEQSSSWNSSSGDRYRVVLRLLFFCFVAS